MQPTALTQRALVAATGQVALHALLNAASLAFLHDHRIQGAALFPGAGMFEMACVTGATLCTEGARKLPGLLGASIAAPLVLQESVQVGSIQDTQTCSDVVGRLIHITRYVTRFIVQAHSESMRFE